MSPCYLSTCPQSHRRPRDAMREDWSDLVSEWTPVWPVLVDDRPAIIALAREVLVVTSTVPERPEHTIGFDQVTDVSAARSVVHIMDRGGNCYDFAFPDGDGAVRAAKVIEEMRAAACEGRAEEAAVGPDQQPEDLLARRSNGHPKVGGRVVRWADDLDLDDDLDDLDLAGPVAARPVAEPVPQVEVDRDVEVHPRPEPVTADPVEGGPGTDDVRAEDDGAVGADEADTVALAVPATDDHPAPAAADERDAEPAHPAAAAEREIMDFPLDGDGSGWGQLPIEREVAMALAAGLPLDGPPAEPARGPEPAREPEARQAAAAEPVIAIPAQGPPPSAESVLLVTTDSVPGRSIAVVHGDVLAVVSWPVAGRPGRSVHETARDRLAQAVLQRGGDAVVGLRYGSTGAVGGDVVAYGTAVTLKPPEQAASTAEAVPETVAAGEG